MTTENIICIVVPVLILLFSLGALLYGTFAYIIAPALVQKWDDEEAESDSEEE